MKKAKQLAQLINNPKGVRFSTLLTLIEAFGFGLDRHTGSHMIYVHASLPIRLNVQSEKGMAKSYQVRQFIKAIEENGLTLTEEETND